MHVHIYIRMYLYDLDIATLDIDGDVLCIVWVVECIYMSLFVCKYESWMSVLMSDYVCVCMYMLFKYCYTRKR